MSAPIICVMGVAGSGKTTLGELLAAELHYEFLDADSLHPSANIQKMAHGIPLNDADRAPWLEAIHAHLVHAFHRHENLVVACSALKQRYRDTLAYGVPLVWVYLKGSEELIRARFAAPAASFFQGTDAGQSVRRSRRAQGCDCDQY